MRKYLIVAVLLAATPIVAQANTGPVGSACIQSERARGNAQLCGCIQQAANMTLNRSEQRRAAGFFRDPHEAQVVRTSRSDSDNAFWTRYRDFGAMAEALCTG